MFEKFSNKAINPYSLKESRELYSLHRHPLFITGIFIRIFLIVFTKPIYQSKWFLPFLEHSINNPFDPWTSFLATGGDISAFPYGSIMYIIYLPFIYIGNLIDQNLSISLFSGYGLSITTCLLDYGVLIAIVVLSRSFSKRLLLLSYWCSPVVLFINYWHGQLDIAPVFLLMWGLCFLKWKRAIASASLIGLAINAKFSLYAAVPFIVVYLYRNRRLRYQLLPFVISLSLTLLLTFIPNLSSSGFHQMVLATQELSKISAVYISYGEEVKIFLLPIGYLISLYFLWRLQRITFDLFLIATGLGFFAILILLPPSPGWYLWVYPFLVFYQLRAKNDYLPILLPFSIAYIFYYSAYSSGSNLNFELHQLKNIYELYNFETLKNYQPVFFTILKGTCILICIRMYTFGIRRNNYYLGDGKSLVVGIAGEAGSFKSILSKSIIDILGTESVSLLNANNYRKWNSENRNLPATTLLNPNSNDFSKLTRDVYSLVEGNNIVVKTYSNHKGTDRFKGYSNIKSKDFIIIQGLYPIYIRRLRDIVNLKIFIKADPVLKKYNSTEERSFEESNIELINKHNAYIKQLISQETHADICFSLYPVNPNVDFNNAISKVKVVASMINGFFHNELMHALISLCGMHIDIENSSRTDYITMSIEGEISSEDIAHVARLLIPNKEDLISSDKYWHSNYIGIMQLITLIHISDISHRGINK